MRYVTYRRGGHEYPGLFSDGRIYSLNDVLKKLEKPPVASLLDFIETSAESEGLADTVSGFALSSCAPVKGAVLCAPIPRPRRNVFCLGKNYAAHATEIKATRLAGRGLPEHPVYFSKTASPALAPEAVLDCPEEITASLDYEAELAVVIGKKGKNIAPQDAAGYVFGYTILNDVSARDLQTAREQWFRGKNLDDFCPMGPVIADAREIPFPPKLAISCRVNGEIRQNASTADLLFDIPAILADLSHGFTLYPGDIISTGTPAGVGAGFNPPRFLQDGDTVECAVEGIGVLRNTIRRR